MNNKQDGSAVRFSGWLTDFEAVFNAIAESMDKGTAYWRIKEITYDAPKGKKQDTDCKLFPYEFVDQRQIGLDGDCFEGEVYFPFPDGRYLVVEYNS